MMMTTSGPADHAPQSTNPTRPAGSGGRASKPAAGSDRRMPVEILLDVIGGKWKVRILDRLTDGPIRFGELKASLDGITQKVLAEQLRQLQRDGLVERTLYPEVPPRVEYELTPLGEELQGPLTQLDRWTRNHLIGDEPTNETDADDTATEAAGVGSGRGSESDEAAA